MGHTPSRRIGGVPDRPGNSVPTADCYRDCEMPSAALRQLADDYWDGALRRNPIAATFFGVSPIHSDSSSA